MNQKTDRLFEVLKLGDLSVLTSLSQEARRESNPSMTKEVLNTLNDLNLRLTSDLTRINDQLKMIEVSKLKFLGDTLKYIDLLFRINHFSEGFLNGQRVDYILLEVSSGVYLQILASDTIEILYPTNQARVRFFYRDVSINPNGTHTVHVIRQFTSDISGFLHQPDIQTDPSIHNSIILRIPDILFYAAIKNTHYIS